MAAPKPDSVAGEEVTGGDVIQSPLVGSKMWFDNCTRMTTMSAIAGMAFGSMRVLSSAHAQGLAVNDIQYLIPQSAISYAVRVGVFTGVFCLSRNYGLTAGQELTAPNEIAASASAGALSGLLMSGAQLRSRNGVRRLVSGAATGALLGGVVGCATALARASQRMVDEAGAAERASEGSREGGDAAAGNGEASGAE